MAMEAVDADGVVIHMLLGKLKPGDIPAPVRDAAIDYGKTHEIETTQVIYEGTRERFPFGHRQPTLICAPLRICSIVLQQGETVLDVLLGDTQHWQTFEIYTGLAVIFLIVCLPLNAIAIYLRSRFGRDLSER